jgi:pilus assembly protein Flp/PilA
MQDLGSSVPPGAASCAAKGSRLSQLRQPRVDHKELPMKNLFVRFMKDDSGATAIEYGLIAAGISVAIISVVQGLGTQLNTTFSSVSSALK